MGDLYCGLWVFWMVRSTGSTPCYSFNNAFGLCSALLVSMASAHYDGKFRNIFIQLGSQWLSSARLHLFSSKLLLILVSERFFLWVPVYGWGLSPCCLLMYEFVSLLSANVFRLICSCSFATIFLVALLLVVW